MYRLHGGTVEALETKFDSVKNTVTFQTDKFSPYALAYTPPVNTATVTFKVVNGTWSDNATGDRTVAVTLTNGKGTLAAADVPMGMKANTGYEGGAWDVTPNTATDGITANVTYTYTFTKQQTGGGGGDPTTYYTLKYVSNGGSKFADERHSSGTTVQLTKTPVWPKHQFLGWYADINLTEQITSIKMTGDKTVYAKWYPAEGQIPGILNGDDHVAYIVGYGDGLVHPTSNITRAEVATIFFRLLKDKVRQDNWMTTNGFSDVSAEAWYNTPVSTMERLGIVKGRGEGIFDPTANITRAEFAAITARFDSAPYTGEDKFGDIADSWARDAINRAAVRGWVKGDSNGNFRPDDYITRAEAVTLINRVLARDPATTDALLPNMKTWADNMDTAAWFYLPIQEATNSHDFDRKTDGTEKWTELLPNRDWAALEK